MSMPAQPSPAIDRAAVVAALQALDLIALAGARWFGAKGRAIRTVELDEGFVLDVQAGHVLAIVSLTLDDRARERYSIALTGQPLREASPGDGAWRALAVAMSRGTTIPALPAGPDDGTTTTITAALVCRPGVAMPRGGPGTERDLGADQSNTSVLLGEELLLKAYRRIQPGLNPDLEMTAFLSEQARFPAVPPLGGFAELVETRHGTSTLAMAQQFVSDGADAFESIVASLTGWILAPGTVSVEVATEVAVDLGALTAGLHAAVADGHGMAEMAPRDATRDEIRSWARSAHEHLDRALDCAPARSDAGRTLRALAPRIQEALTVLDALPTTSEVVRAHGDLHLGQILIAPDGYRIIDFEGLPLTTTDERRAHRHPLRDVASMLRSLDHVARSAQRRAAAQAQTYHIGLDVDAWIERARERFLDAYRDGLLEARVVPASDPDLLRAFEVDSELTEFFYAATYLPDWLYAPTEGIRALFDAPS